MDEKDEGTKEGQKEYGVEAVEPEPEGPDVVEAEVVKAEAVEEPVGEGVAAGEPPEEEPPGGEPPGGEPPEEKKGFIGQFPRLFWVMNSMELFERGAYYGMMAVLHVHVLKNLLFAPEIWGSLYAMLIVLLYFIPLVSGALALKYGFKKVLIVAFAVLILGYFVLSTVQPGQLGVLALGLIFIGIGAGAFKPIISAAIAHITPEGQRNLGYSIYYWMINLGAFAVPLTLGFAFPEELRHLYYWIFVISGSLIIINTVIALLLVTEPVEPQKDLKIKQAVMKIVPALKDQKFVVLLVIYSGFWFMYAVNHTFLGPYMVDFKIMPSWFSLPFLAIVNPGTIIATGPFLGKLVEKYKSLNVMMVGMIIYVIGMMIAFFARVPALFLTGIIVFSIGEFITHPGFISYVSKIAPKDKVTVYMACVFIPTGVGNAVAGGVQGIMYSSLVESAHMPKLFGSIIAAVGCLTIASFILYNRWINKLAQEEDLTFKVDTSLWTKVITALVALMFIPVVIGIGYVGGTDTYYGGEEGEEGPELTDWSVYGVVQEEKPTITEENLPENSEYQTIYNISEDNIISVTLTLTWTDEPDELGFENDPDEFSLEVEDPNGTLHSQGPETNPRGGEGSITIDISFNPDKDPYMVGTGNYQVRVICGTCGDQRSMGPLGIIVQPDDNGDFELTFKYDYYKKAG